MTGADGFVGRHFCRRLGKQGTSAVAAVRSPGGPDRDNLRRAAVGEIDGGTDWSGALAGCGVVVHLAARAHVMRDVASDSLGEFRRVNVDGAINLARQARDAGIRRFVFVSSIGVNGQSNNRPFTEQDSPKPEEAYALSKWEAERALSAALARSATELVIVRPPLVYGFDAPGNFQRLLGLVRRGMPLPFGAVRNCRSLVGVENLGDFLARCIDHPAAAGETFLIADGEDVSTPELLRRMGASIGRPAKLLPVPPRLLTAAAAVAGRRAEIERLCGSLQVDADKARRLLGWSAPLSMAEGLAAPL